MTTKPVTVEFFANTKWTKSDIAFNREQCAESVQALLSARKRLISTLQHSRVVAESQKDSSLALLIDNALADLTTTDLPESLDALVALHEGN